VLSTLRWFRPEYEAGLAAAHRVATERRR